jgi:two-component system, sensor histidine kinase and response regulator
MDTVTTRSIDLRCPFESLPRPVLPMPRPSPPLGVLTDVRKGDPIVRTHVGSVAPLADLSAPVLDADVIERLERLGESINEDLLGQLTVLFLSDADRQIAELRRAIADFDAAAVVGSAHSLRGASANLGARELASLCADLEADAAVGKLSTGTELVDALEAELVRVSDALQRTVAVP